METAAAEGSNSKMTPIKPHFFKPLLPGLLQGLLIPVAFFKHYLNDHGKSEKRDVTVLRTILGEWTVNIKDGRFEDGWRDFAQHHSLNVGDMLVFRYEGECVFDVMVFDRTACERNYDGEHHQPLLSDVKQESSSLQKFTDCSLQGEKEKVDISGKAHSKPKEVASSASLQAYPSFTSTLRPYNMKEFRFFIPMEFARSNGLCKRQCEMLIVDGHERKSWRVRLNQKSGGVYISGNGYRDLVADKGLRAGDNISFELISNGTMPVMVFHAPRSKRAMATFPKTKKEAMKRPLKASQNVTVKKKLKRSQSQYSRYFISTVTTASIEYSRLYIPTCFARLHGLNKYCEMTIKDPRERLWLVSLMYHKFKNRLHIRRGWKRVALSNGLKHGQDIKFMLVKAEKTLTMNLTVCGGSKSGRSNGLCKEEPLVAKK